MYKCSDSNHVVCYLSAPPSGQTQDSCQPCDPTNVETSIKEEPEIQDIQTEREAEDGGGSSRLAEPPLSHNMCDAQHFVSPTLLPSQEIKVEEDGEQSGTEQRPPLTDSGAAQRHQCPAALKTRKKTEKQPAEARPRRLKNVTRTRPTKLLPPLSSGSSNPSQGLQRWHSCRECGKGFSFACQLEVHMRWHTKEKPYSCSVCCKCFTTLSMLKRHHRIHTGEKPFRCHVCGKCFNQSAHLNTHFRLHTRERPAWSQGHSK